VIIVARDAMNVFANETGDSTDQAMVKALIFDIDGTIIDSVGAHIEAWKRTFAHFGKEVSDEEIRRHIGEGSDDMLPVFFSEQELHRFRPELERYRGEIFNREYLPSLKAFPEVRELFERIKNDGKKIALASTAPAKEIDIYKEIARIADLVDCAVCSEEVSESKPHSDICGVALRKLGKLAPPKVIAIGDTKYDVESAARNNVCTIGLLCGGGTREELQQAGCVALYHDPADLRAHMVGGFWAHRPWVAEMPSPEMSG
jgi:HAD superfamily hydrolase (TIGR01549 family)